MTQKQYGFELILDLHNCDPSKFNRRELKKYFIELCNVINMKRALLKFWDYKWAPWAKRKAPPHLKGTSAVQFIMTSTVVIHTLEDMRAIHINIFTCKDLDREKAEKFTSKWFDGKIIQSLFIERL